MKTRSLTALTCLCLLASACDDGSGGAGAACDDAAAIEQSSTALVWLRCPLGTCWDGELCQGEPLVWEWGGALEACPDGYRLPTRQEYVDLLGGCAGGSAECDSCDMNPTCAPMFTSAGEYVCSADVDRAYHTSTEVDDDSDRVYVCSLDAGEISMSEKTMQRPVRCLQ